jgi:hypothetical protein
VHKQPGVPMAVQPPRPRNATGRLALVVLALLYRCARTAAPPSAKAAPLRAAVLHRTDLTHNRADGYKCYNSPALVQLPCDGVPTLLGFVEMRKECHDNGFQIDIGMFRSTGSTRAGRGSIALMQCGVRALSSSRRQLRWPWRRSRPQLGALAGALRVHRHTERLHQLPRARCRPARAPPPADDAQQL